MATVYSQTWERTLLPLAYEAEHLEVAPIPLPVSDMVLLDRAYAYCNSITSTHSRTFYMATSLLPPDKRRAMLNSLSTASGVTCARDAIAPSRKW
jgi:15-cis-phytoene synthase